MEEYFVRVRVPLSHVVTSSSGLDFENWFENALETAARRVNDAYWDVSFERLPNFLTFNYTRRMTPEQAWVFASKWDDVDFLIDWVHPYKKSIGFPVRCDRG